MSILNANLQSLSSDFHSPVPEDGGVTDPGLSSSGSETVTVGSGVRTRFSGRYLASRGLLWGSGFLEGSISVPAWSWQGLQSGALLFFREILSTYGAKFDSSNKWSLRIFPSTGIGFSASQVSSDLSEISVSLFLKSKSFSSNLRWHCSQIFHLLWPDYVNVFIGFCFHLVRGSAKILFTSADSAESFLFQNQN